MVGIVKLIDENVDSLIGALGKDVGNKDNKIKNNDKKEVLTNLISAWEEDEKGNESSGARYKDDNDDEIIS